MNIGNFEAKPDQPYIIAEVGSNFTNLEDCINSVRAAAQAGANAVKFQLFDHKSLYGIEQTRGGYGYDPKFELHPEWLRPIKNECDRARINLLCTVFNADLVRTVDQYVSAHKVASSDIAYEPLLAEMSKLSKPVILSTGAATETEIKLALATLSNVPVCLLYCVANYPAKNVDLTVIDRLKAFSKPVGFSDHTLDYIYLPYAAVKHHGAIVIEKHFTAISELTPDSGHSLNPDQFKLMVDKIRGKVQSQIGPIDEERDMLLKAKRRLIATEAIKKGDMFRKGKNFGMYRALYNDTKGLDPWNSSLINNRLATRDIEAGEPIGVGDFQ